MRRKMTVVLLDDELASLDVMLHYVQMHPQLELVAKFTDPEEAMPWFQENEADLLVSDIEMPGLNGIDFVHSLVKKPLVILCTGHQDFALRGYEVSPVDFLVKPVRHDSFLRAIEKACFLLKIEINESDAGKADATYVMEVTTGHFVRVDFDDIQYIESKDKLITIHCLNYSVVTRTSLLALLRVLPKPDFMQIHRSFIVSTDLICRLKEGSVMLRDVDVEIPLGGMHAHNLRSHIEERQLKFFEE
jgi:DNA-binding LytR/AlgR family response regulator